MIKTQNQLSDMHKLQLEFVFFEGGVQSGTNQIKKKSNLLKWEKILAIIFIVNRKGIT